MCKVLTNLNISENVSLYDFKYMYFTENRNYCTCRLQLMLGWEYERKITTLLSTTRCDLPTCTSEEVCAMTIDVDLQSRDVKRNCSIIFNINCYCCESVRRKLLKMGLRFLYALKRPWRAREARFMYVYLKLVWTWTLGVPFWTQFGHRGNSISQNIAFTRTFV